MALSRWTHLQYLLAMLAAPDFDQTLNINSNSLEGIRRSADHVHNGVSLLKGMPLSLMLIGDDAGQAQASQSGQSS